MNYKMMGRIIGMVLFIEAAFMLPALCICAFCGDRSGAVAFLLSIIIISAVAALLVFGFARGVNKGFYAREGLVSVAICWIAMSFFGCLPFYLSRQIPSFVDCLFEMVSGFTTTGASVVSDVEAMSKGILYWRSFSHWLGGMGVLVFMLAVVPMGKTGKNKGFTLHLLRAESPGPTVGKLTPKMRRTALTLYLIYVVLTLINLIFLLIGRMPIFDAVCTALGTAGTGGFGIKNDSLGSYSPYLQNVTTVFMILFGINFSCYYLILLKQIKEVIKDEELHLYLGIIAASIVLITWNIHGSYPTLSESVRHAAFQVGSIITTTGYSTVDFDKWPSFSKTILLALMIIGACAGSTGGGMKCARAVLLFKGLRKNIRQTLNPQIIKVVRVNGKPVDEQTMVNTNSFLSAYMIIIILSILILSLDEFSVETNISAVLCTFNNIGPGLDAVGPTCNFSIYSPLSKAVIIFDMLLGRLEIFPIMVLFSRDTWKRM